jgi:hypothetical protein
MTSSPSPLAAFQGRVARLLHDDSARIIHQRTNRVQKRNSTADSFGMKADLPGWWIESPCTLYPIGPSGPWCLRNAVRDVFPFNRIL